MKKLTKRHFTNFLYGIGRLIKQKMRILSDSEAQNVSFVHGGVHKSETLELEYRLNTMEVGQVMEIGKKELHYKHSSGVSAAIASFRNRKHKPLRGKYATHQNATHIYIKRIS